MHRGRKPPNKPLGGEWLHSLFSSCVPSTSIQWNSDSTKMFRTRTTASQQSVHIECGVRGNFPSMPTNFLKESGNVCSSEKGAPSWNLEISSINTESLRYVGFFFQQRQKRKMLEVPLHTMKLYLCAKTSNWCCSIKFSKHRLPALSNVTQNPESWNFILLLVRKGFPLGADASSVFVDVEKVLTCFMPFIRGSLWNGKENSFLCQPVTDRSFYIPSEWLNFKAAFSGAQYHSQVPSVIRLIAPQHMIEDQKHFVARY